MSNDLKASGPKPSAPISNDQFRFFGLSPGLLEVLDELGYEKMTPIQQQSIPLLLQGKDVIGESKTGSGKTAAFSLPILEKIKLRSRHVQALILCPTRELCTQVAREMRKLARKQPGLQVLILSGGQPIRPQLGALEKGVHIAVGTPGRIIDHLSRGKLDLSQVATIVLDEADRMLDMGFQEDMEEILKAAPAQRQTVFFSATYPHSIEAMSTAYQRRPVRISIADDLGGDGEKGPAIKQHLYEFSNDQKQPALFALLREHQPESAIVFCNHKATVIELTNALIDLGTSAACIHGDLEQYDRDRVMAKFRNRSVRVLIATDVAARGIDVEDLDIVFNYDLPHKTEVYVHRIGRTGRAGKKGLAISFATPREHFKIEAIEEFVSNSFEKKQIKIDSALMVKTGSKREQEQKREAPSAPANEVKILKGGAAMETLYISGGRKEKVRPGDILGALTGEAGGLQASDIGKIEIHDHFAYVAVAKRVARAALESLKNGKIKGRKFQVELVK